MLPSWRFGHLLAIVSPYEPWTGGPVKAHPRPYEFATCGSELCTRFVTRLCLRLTLSHTLTQHSTSTPLPERERHGFTPIKAVTRVSLGVDQTPLLPSEAGLNLNLGSYWSEEWDSQVGS
jgi:hypothetical protein